MLKNRGKKLPISEKIMYFCSGFQLNLADNMEYISVIQFAEKYGISESQHCQ